MQIVFRNTKLSFIKHWGTEESAFIIRHFRTAEHSVPDLVHKVISMGISTSSPEENKGHYLNFDNFQEIYEDFMLIHNGEMMAIIFACICFVNWNFGARSDVRRSLSVRRHRAPHLFSGVSNDVVWAQIYRGDLTVDMSVLYNQDECSFRNFYYIFFLMEREFLSFQVPAHHEKKCGRQRNLVARGTGTVHGCLGHRICADKSASVAHVVAKKVGQLFPRRFAIWHLSSGKKLFHGHGGH